MTVREAVIADIKEIQEIMNADKDNTLSDTSLVTDKDCEEFITVRGKGWVCETANKIVGFSIVDLKDNNIRALFIRPEFEDLGIGRRLYDIMLDWYFSNTRGKAWLGTLPNTRAGVLYRK